MKKLIQILLLTLFGLGATPLAWGQPCYPIPCGCTIPVSASVFNYDCLTGMANIQIDWPSGQGLVDVHIYGDNGFSLTFEDVPGNSWTAFGLPSGNYSVWVIGNTCAGFNECVIIAPLDITVESISQCGGNFTWVGTTGGLPPFSYQWSDGWVSGESFRQDLTPGTYTVTVIDAAGCTTEGSVPVNTFLIPELMVQGFNSHCIQPNGSATAMVSPGTGTAPFQFFWNNGQSGPNITGLLPGTYTVTVIDANYCSNSGSVPVGNNGVPSPQTNLSATTCDLTQVGIFTQNLTNTQGCDSLVITHITLLPSDTTYQSTAVCNPAQTGVFTQVLSNQYSCDSVVFTTNVFVPLDSTVFELTCDSTKAGTITSGMVNMGGCVYNVDTVWVSQSILFTLVNSQTCDPAQAGTVVQTLTSFEGCDSTVFIVTELKPSNFTLLPTDFVCDLSDVGVDTLFLTNSFGCDSLVIQPHSLADDDLTVLPVQYVCDFSQTGIDTTVFSNQMGCDSVVVTTTSLAPDNFVLLPIEYVCDFSQTGVDTTILTNSFGCDSVIVQSSSLAPIQVTNLPNEFVCSLSEVHSDTTIHVSFYGCDSLVVKSWVLAPSNFTLLPTDFVCDLSDVGVDTLFLTNSFGCDSLVIQPHSLADDDLTVLPVQYVCDFSQTGIDTTVFSNQMGCDSVVVTTTSLAPDNFVLLPIEYVCDFSQTGVDTTILTNSFGCDSVIVETMMLAPGSTTILPPEFVCNAIETGLDTLILTNYLGCDSLILTPLVLSPADTIFLSGNVCEPGGAGVFTEVLTNQFGCDSVVVTTLSFIPLTLTTIIDSVTCLNGQIANDGLLAVMPSGGNGIYNYIWSTGETGPIISDLAPGIYGVTVTSGECETEMSFQLFSPNCLPEPPKGEECDVIITHKNGHNPILIWVDPDGPETTEMEYILWSPQHGIYTVTKGKLSLGDNEIITQGLNSGFYLLQVFGKVNGKKKMLRIKNQDGSWGANSRCIMI